MESVDIYDIQLRLDKIRENKKISQTELSEKIGITRQAYSPYRKREAVMSSDIFVKLGTFLEVDFNKVIYGNQNSEYSLTEEAKADYKKRCDECDEKDKQIRELMLTIENLNHCLGAYTKKKSSGNVG